MVKGMKFKLYFFAGNPFVKHIVAV